MERVEVEREPEENERDEEPEALFQPRDRGRGGRSRRQHRDARLRQARTRLKSSFAALTCGGHVLLEDVPGIGRRRCWRGRSAAPLDCATHSSGSSARWTCCRRTSPGSPSSTRRSATSSSGGGRSSRRPPRRRDQPGYAEDAVGPPRGDGRGPGHGRRRHAPAAPTPSPCSRPRTRSSTRARSRCRRPSSTASCCARRSAIRASWRNGASSRSSASGTRSPSSQPVAGREDIQEPREAAQHVYVDGCCTTDRRPRPRDPRTRGRLDREPGSRQPSRSSASRAPGRSRTDAATSCRRTSSGCSCPCSCTVSSSRPALDGAVPLGRPGRGDRRVPPGVPRLAPASGLRPGSALRSWPRAAARMSGEYLPARIVPPPDGPRPRHDAQRAPWPRDGGRCSRRTARGTTSAPSTGRRRPGSRRLRGADESRRPRPLCGRGAARRDRLRPQPRARLSTRRRSPRSTSASRRGARETWYTRAPGRGGFGAASITPAGSRSGCRPAASDASPSSVTSGSTRTPRTAPADGVERGRHAPLRAPARRLGRQLRFVLSDFIGPPSRLTWPTAVEHLWDIVPVVIQDPVWEQSFPEVHPIVAPLRHPDSAPRRARPADEEEGRGAPGGRTRAARRSASRASSSSSTWIRCRLVERPAEPPALFLDWTEAAPEPAVER